MSSSPDIVRYNKPIGIKMGEARRRLQRDPLYGVIPKKGVISPRWVVHKGVLFLVGEGDSIACLPASNHIVLNEEQTGVLEDILSSNPSLLTPPEDDGTATDPVEGINSSPISSM